MRLLLTTTSFVRSIESDTGGWPVRGKRDHASGSAHLHYSLSGAAAVRRSSATLITSSRWLVALVKLVSDPRRSSLRQSRRSRGAPAAKRDQLADLTQTVCVTLTLFCVGSIEMPWREKAKDTERYGWWIDKMREKGVEPIKVSLRQHTGTLLRVCSVSSALPRLPLYLTGHRHNPGQPLPPQMEAVPDPLPKVLKLKERGQAQGKAHRAGCPPGLGGSCGGCCGYAHVARRKRTRTLCVYGGQLELTWLSCLNGKVLGGGSVGECQ